MYFLVMSPSLHDIFVTSLAINISLTYEDLFLDGELSTCFYCNPCSIFH